MAAPRLDHVGLNVADLGAMADWYAGAFGYSIQHQFDLADLDLRIVMLVAPDGRRFELLNRSETLSGLRAPTPVVAAQTSGYGHVCFVTDDLDGTFARLIELGASPVLAPGPAPEAGVRMAWVHDPEQNLVELITAPHDAVADR